MLLSRGHIHEALWLADIIGERCQVSEFMVGLHQKQGKLQEDDYANPLDIANHFDTSDDVDLLQAIDRNKFWCLFRPRAFKTVSSLLSNIWRH